MPEKIRIPNFMNFVFGGLSGMAATCCVHPLDVTKNRMQIAVKNEFRSSLHCMQSAVERDGFTCLYKGIGAGLLRQATYTTIRLGVYSFLQQEYRRKHDRKPPFLALVGMGMTAGAVGAFFGTPSEVVLIRMSADGRLRPAERRNYKSLGNAVVRILREEGPRTLFSGCSPTVVRAVVVNVAQLTTYTKVKELFADSFRMRDGIPLHFAASMLSGLVTTVASMPLDLAKTRLQNMKTLQGAPEFKGPLDVLAKVVRSEGIFALWKGFTPYYARLGPHTVFTFIFLEQSLNLYTKYATKAV